MGTDPSWSNTDVHEAPTPTHHLGLAARGNTCYLKGNTICYMEQSNCTKTINCQNDTRCLFDNSQKRELTSSSIHTSLAPYLICGTLAYLWLPQDCFGSCYIGYMRPAVQYLSSVPSEYSQAISEPEKLGTVMLPMYEVAWTTKKIISYYLKQIGNNPADSSYQITTEMTTICTVILQNRLTLDFMLAYKGKISTLTGK